MDVTAVAEFVKATTCTGSETVELFAGEQIVTEGCVEFRGHCAIKAIPLITIQIRRAVWNLSDMRETPGWLLISNHLVWTLVRRFRIAGIIGLLSSLQQFPSRA